MPRKRKEILQSKDQNMAESDSNSGKENVQTNTESNLKQEANEKETKKAVKDMNTISGFPIHCVLCQITEPFKCFTDVVAHLYGQRHRRVGYKMVYLDSSTSITFKGQFLYCDSDVRLVIRYVCIRA